jgi:Methyltransferase domain
VRTCVPGGIPRGDLDFIIPGDLGGKRWGVIDPDTGACHLSLNQCKKWGANYLTPAVEKVAERPEFAAIKGATPYSMRRGGISVRLRSEDPQTVAKDCGTSSRMLDEHYAFAIDDLRRFGPRPFNQEWTAARAAHRNPSPGPQLLLPRDCLTAIASFSGVAQFHWDPDTYLELIRKEVLDYEHLQAQATAATGTGAMRVLELGIGTGETARRVLTRHPRARLIGLDASREMVDRARHALPRDRVELRVAQLEDPLPDGPFDVVIGALAIHHLDGRARHSCLGAPPA